MDSPSQLQSVTTLHCLVTRGAWCEQLAQFTVQQHPAGSQSHYLLLTGLTLSTTSPDTPPRHQYPDSWLTCISNVHVHVMLLLDLNFDLDSTHIHVDTSGVRCHSSLSRPLPLPLHSWFPFFIDSCWLCLSSLSLAELFPCWDPAAPSRVCTGGLSISSSSSSYSCIKSGWQKCNQT